MTTTVEPDDWPDEKLFFDILTLLCMGSIVFWSVEGVIDLIKAPGGAAL